VSFVAITLCVVSQRVFFVVYFVIDSVQKLLDTPLFIICGLSSLFCHIYLAGQGSRCLNSMYRDMSAIRFISRTQLKFQAMEHRFGSVEKRVMRI